MYPFCSLPIAKKTWKWPVFIILKFMLLSIDTLRHEVTIQSSTLKKKSETSVLEQKLLNF